MANEEKYYTILTDIGKAKIANATGLGTKINFATMKIGDGGGAYYNPTESQTDLVNTVWQGPITHVEIDEVNSNWINIEVLIPAADGGFFIREYVVFDSDVDMIAISKCAETYKPLQSDGATKEITMKMILAITNTSSIVLKIDPTVIFAKMKDLQDLQNEFQDEVDKLKTEHNEDVTNLEEEIQEIKTEISNDNIITQNLSYGMNSVIKNASKNSVSPKFAIQGKTLINLLGKDGNCEDVSKWGTYQSTSSLDSTNKVFGSNGIKITINNTQGNISRALSSWNINTTKYYLISAYLKNGNAASGVTIMKDSSGGGVGRALTNPITDSTKFARVGVILQPSDFGTTNNITVSVFGSSGQYAYVDGIMVNEITASEYALGIDALLAQYPYVDSYSCLQNPYIEVRHDNLVRNGNGEEGVAWWGELNQASISIVNSKLCLTTTVSGGSSSQRINLKNNTDYYLKFNGTDSNSKIVIQGSNDNFVTITNIGQNYSSFTFNSNVYKYYRVTLLNLVVSSTYFDSIMLVEGTTAPSSYNTCRLERVVLETKLTSDDSITYDNGEVTGQIWWKHRTLFGKDYDWQYFSDSTGFKSIYTLIGAVPVVADSQKVVKYDGKILALNDLINTVESQALDTNLLRQYIQVSDTDTGWAESVNPNADEVKAFMNGWKAVIDSSVNRYTFWINIIDGSIPSIVPTTAVSSAYTANATSLVVTDASKFSVGDTLYITNSSLIPYGFASIGAINGNTLTLTRVCTVSVPAGATVMRADNGSSDLRLLNYCKNNVAPGYEGYQLHYKLANPEPITDDNCHIHGDIPILDVGDNYLYLDSGIVLGEVATPQLNSSVYELNNVALPISKLKNKVDNNFIIYKNLTYNTSAWTFGSDTSAYGNSRCSELIANFDANATYTVDYKILATQAPQVGNIVCSYVYDIVDSINKMQEEINNRQEHDSIFDTIVDLSLYEKIVQSYAMSMSWWGTGNSLYIRTYIPFSTIKKAIPVVSIDSANINTGSASGALINISSMLTMVGINVIKTGVYITYYVYDATTLSNIKSYGLISWFSITADCRGRL